MAIRPWEIERQRGTASAPPIGISQRLSGSGGAQSRFASELARATSGLPEFGDMFRGRGGTPDPSDVLEDLGSTGPQDDRDAEEESTSTRPFGGSATLPPLTPDQLAALEQRRRASLRGLQEAETMAEDLRVRAELEDIGRRLGIEEDVARQRREGMVGLAARGVARSPLFANPFRRELARVQQQQIAESQQTLANTLDQLQSALSAARQRREQELSQIAFDEAMARSNVQRLLGIN